MEHLPPPLMIIFQATLFGVGLIVIAPLLWVPISRWRSEPRLAGRLIWLFALPTPWVLLSYWSSFNRAVGIGHDAPPETHFLVVATLCATLGLAIASGVMNRDARGFFFGWSLVNLWFALIGAVWCLMETGGDWI